MYEDPRRSSSAVSLPHGGAVGHRMATGDGFPHHKASSQIHSASILVFNIQKSSFCVF